MNAIEKVKSALKRLELSLSEQKIYLSLLTEGQATARVLAARTNITRPSVYDQIKSLKAMRLVNELDIDGKAHYAAADIKHLSALLDDRIDHLEQSRDFLTSALPELRESLKTVDPKVRFFRGEDGLKQLLKDVMWHDNETIKIFWSAQAMGDVFDEKFLTWFDDRRTKRNLTIESLWPVATKKTAVNLFRGLNGDKQKALKAGTFAMSYLIYGSKVAFISSGTESFGYIIESEEHVALQKLHFYTLWQNAKTI